MGYDLDLDDWCSGIELTYCKTHDGLWPHECGCLQNGLQYEEEK